MKKSYHSRELAGLYEKQGYYEDALGHLQALYRENEEPHIAEAIARIKQKIASSGSEVKRAEVAGLIERWLRLIILQQRLKNYKGLKNRVV